MSSLESSSADGYPSCAVPEVEGFQPFNATTGPKPIGPFVPPRPRLVHAQQTAGCNVGVSSGSAVSARFDAKATLPDTGTAEALQSVLRQESELRAISGSGGQRVLPSRSDQGPVAAVPGQRLADDLGDHREAYFAVATMIRVLRLDGQVVPAFLTHTERQLSWELALISQGR